MEVGGEDAVLQVVIGLVVVGGENGLEVSECCVYAWMTLNEVCYLRSLGVKSIITASPPTPR